MPDAVRFRSQERVAEEYYHGSWMHTRVMRRRAGAKAILKQYRDMAKGGCLRIAADRAAFRSRRRAGVAKHALQRALAAP